MLAVVFDLLTGRMPVVTLWVTPVSVHCSISVATFQRCANERLAMVMVGLLPLDVSGQLMVPLTVTGWSVETHGLMMVEVGWTARLPRRAAGRTLTN